MQPVLPKPDSTSLKDKKKSVSTMEDKELRKKLRNRQSALAARERKKARMLQLEQTVSELQIANQRLFQENEKYKQDISDLKNPNSSAHSNYGSANRQHWQHTPRSNEEDCRKIGATSGHGHSDTRTQPGFQPTVSCNLKAESQTRAETAIVGQFTKCGSNMPMRKRNMMNLYTNPAINPEYCPSSCSMKVPEKRRKSCPTYPTSDMPNELQWPNSGTRSMSDNTLAVGQSYSLSHSAMLPNQRRLSHHSFPQRPLETFHEKMQGPMTPMLPNGHSNLPPINDVLGRSSSSANDSQFQTNVSQCFWNYNLTNGDDVSTKWENSECIYKEFTTLTNCNRGTSHNLMGAATGEGRDSYQHPVKVSPKGKETQTPTAAGQNFHDQRYCGYGAAKTYDEIFEWISEGF